MPEVENVVRRLAPVLPGREVTRARLTAPDLYRRDSRQIGTLVGVRLTVVERMGKAILIRGRRADGKRADDVHVVVHLGMTGKLLWVPRTAPLEPHAHARIFFAGGGELRYVDPRRFGYFFIGDRRAIDASFDMGPDPFAMKAGELARALAGRRAPLKALLLDQRVVAGLGNIYVDELLFRCGIHPRTAGADAARDAARLLRAARVILKRAIESGGTTIRDYRRPDGSSGQFQRRLAVYGREGEGCLRCGSAVEKIVLAQRGTHFCPRCQPEVIRRPGTGSADRSRRAGPRRAGYTR
ncbi:MAG TPA: bifunctional DNA-formamidopyrimidine glycosylase/DNA-(apurinic or apyrimidinic site) lyase [Candidatus Krumholzibacteria bacterium]|nr:bifunctional DNA-formamidopyrimidine glycosylase/DNA-(apurinic or apyrimidinic site) lyase [Candidatus Krumholzibacteria bacterium]